MTDAPTPEAGARAEATLLTGLAPVIAPTTRVVVLGSFPGQASLLARQYYAHPRNQFWPLLSALWQLDLQAMSYPRRLEAMLARGLGLWDVYASCQRQGSLDSAIRHPVFNDLASLAQRAPDLRAIAHNGGESARAMRHTGKLAVAVMQLPSTSPAHASWRFERKLAAWRDALAPHLDLPA